jgi:hypothetical protein
MRSALFGDVTQRRLVVTDVKSIGLLFKVLEDGMDRLSRNVGKKLPLLAA